MSHTDFDIRMKEYEHADRQFLPESPYYVIRLDGKGFSKYTKSFKGDGPDPFNALLHEAFTESCKELGKQVEGAMACYTQSDELSILIKGYEDDPSRTPWFGGNVQKWVSVSASILTAKFNSVISRSTNNVNAPLAYFDSRVFSLPKNEVNNYFVWRQKDAIRNSVSMYAHTNFSHKSLHGVDTTGQKEKLLEKGLDWNALEMWKQRGTLVAKVKKLVDAEWTDKKGVKHLEKDVERSVWEKVSLPLFTEKSILEVVKVET